MKNGQVLVGTEDLKKLNCLAGWLAAFLQTSLSFSWNRCGIADSLIVIIEVRGGAPVGSVQGADIQSGFRQWGVMHGARICVSARFSCSSMVSEDLCLGDQAGKLLKRALFLLSHTLFTWLHAVWEWLWPFAKLITTPFLYLDFWATVRDCIPLQGLLVQWLFDGSDLLGHACSTEQGEASLCCCRQYGWMPQITQIWAPFLVPNKNMVCSLCFECDSHSKQHWPFSCILCELCNQIQCALEISAFKSDVFPAGECGIRPVQQLWAEIGQAQPIMLIVQFGWLARLVELQFFLSGMCACLKVAFVCWGAQLSVTAPALHAESLRLNLRQLQGGEKKPVFDPELFLQGNVNNWAKWTKSLAQWK